MTTPETFDFDRLQQRWRAQDARIDEMLKINQRMLRSLEHSGAKTALHGVARMLWTQIAVDALAVFGLGAFIGNRIESAQAEMRFLVPAAVLLLAAIAVLVSAVVQWVQLAQIDPAGPVTAMQHKLAALRTLRIRMTKAVIVSALLLWVPIAIVGLRALFGFDSFAWFPGWFFWINLGVGAALIPLTLWASHAFGDRLGRNPAVRSLADDLAGRSMNEAREKLAELAAFEREDGR